jgi:hypothetical protein
MRRCWKHTDSKTFHSNVLVKDNASYLKMQLHPLTSFASRKQEMIGWFSTHNLYFNKKLYKTELCSIIKEDKSLQNVLLFRWQTNI